MLNVLADEVPIQWDAATGPSRYFDVLYIRRCHGLFPLSHECHMLHSLEVNGLWNDPDSREAQACDPTFGRFCDESVIPHLFTLLNEQTGTLDKAWCDIAPTDLAIFVYPHLRVVPADGHDVEVTVVVKVDKLRPIVMIDFLGAAAVEHVLRPLGGVIDVLKH